MVAHKKNWEEQTMAESNYHQASLQHLAHLRQQQSPTAGDHNPWQAEAHLEAHLRAQQALQAVQQLEHQRLHLRPHGARHLWPQK
jgi:hypothetical protein